MNRDDAMRFLAENHRGVFCALRKDGRPHQSPVVYALMDGRIRVSSTWDRVKTQLLKRDPRASMCVITEKFFADYLAVEGKVRLIEDPEGQENLALYKAITGGPPENLDEYLKAMKEEKRLVLEMSVDRVYPVEG
ncbi:MAG: PPOX class F420-dependent oxidoreductase [Nitrospinota bacterium]